MSRTSYINLSHRISLFMRHKIPVMGMFQGLLVVRRYHIPQILTLLFCGTTCSWCPRCIISPFCNSTIVGIDSSFASRLVSHLCFLILDPWVYHSATTHPLTSSTPVSSQGEVKALPFIALSHADPPHCGDNTPFFVSPSARQGLWEPLGHTSYSGCAYMHSHLFCRTRFEISTCGWHHFFIPTLAKRSGLGGNSRTYLTSLVGVHRGGEVYLSVPVPYSDAAVVSFRA